MSFLDDVLRPYDPLHLDSDTAARMERVLQGIEPDPLFRRRLRSSVVNHYVAAREGHLQRPSPGRRMGNLGRLVLYASVVLALGVSAVGAASQESLPGDALYGVKLRLEEIRLSIAPPSVRDELAALALEERIQEMEELAAAGAWALVPAAAERVAAAEGALAAVEGDLISDTGASDHAIDALEDVLAEAPDAAWEGLQRALVAAGGDPSDIDSRPGSAAGNGVHPRAPQGQGSDKAASKPDKASTD